MLFVATRIHGSSVLQDDPTLSKLDAFLTRALTYADHIVIATEFHPMNPTLFNAVNQHVIQFAKELMSLKRTIKRNRDSKLCSSDSESDDEAHVSFNIHVLPIVGWSGFTPALNALANKASEIATADLPANKDPHYILYQSLEVLPTVAAVAELRQRMNSNILVCGAALEGHLFDPGLSIVHLSGATCPWNTFALWTLSSLLRTGFLPVSDGHASVGGVEEVACVAVQQKLFPNSSGCLLVKLNDNQITWGNKFDGIGRKKMHEEKMKSKISRAMKQLEVLEMKHNTSMVSHIDARTHNPSNSSKQADPIVVPPKYFNKAIRRKELRMKVVDVDTSSSSSPSSSPSSSSFAYVQPHLAFTNETVLLTGGAGFIGSHTAHRLLERGNKVVIIDNFNDYYDVKQKEENIRFLKNVVIKMNENSIDNSSASDTNPLVIVRGSICDMDVLNDIFVQHQPTLVVHLAARAGVRPSLEDPQLYVNTNVLGTTNLLEMSRINHVKHFVYASSSSVYGGSMKSDFSEEDIVDHPVSPYAATKKSTELMASTYHHLYQLNTSGLRFFTVYGPRGRPDMAPYKFLKRAHEGIPIDQYGDGSSERDYTYVGDIVDGIIRTLDRPFGCQVYNLGNGLPITLKKFINLVKNVASSKHELIINYMDDQPGDVKRTCANITKAKTMLGYTPRTKFEDGLRQTFEWFQNKK
jgi:UDP-glucuronate 4-epimerase